jgi:hypothetical protein
MFNYSLSNTAALPSRIRAHTTATTSSAPTHLLNFSKTTHTTDHNFVSSPAPKSWFTKKFIPTVKRVGDIAGKVATVASIL